ncbi:MAG: alkaline phosphatase family protein [Anaerolineae bacterium]
MKTAHPSRIALFTSLLVCILIALLSYLWANALMDSLYAYRSPLHQSPPTPGEFLNTRLSQRLVFVLVDGLRLDTSLDVQVMPILNDLRTHAATATMHSRPPSYSDPGYTVLLTGAWPELNDGPVMNLPYDLTPTWTQDNLFSAAHRAGLRTAIAGLNWFEKLIPQEAVDQAFYTPLEDQLADRQVTAAALDWLQKNAADFILIHLDQVDYAGHHEGGPRDPRWNAAAQRVDSLLGEIVSALDLKRDTVLIVSDHGHILRGGHGGNEPDVLTEPFVLVGAGIIPGQYAAIQQSDVAPTLATLLGTSLPASSQGRPLLEMLTLTEQQRSLVQKAEAEQQNALLHAYTKAIAQKNPAAGSPLPAEQARAYLESVRQNRLNQERMPRFLVAASFALLAGNFVVRTIRRTTPWLLGGALIYTALFHFGYAILQGRTYSLSSVASADDIIASVMLNATLAFGVPWIIFFVRKRQSPARFASLTILFTLTTLTITAIPLFWSFAINGPLITWTLPDFPSMFLGFLATLQCLTLAALGTLLSTIGALLTRWIPPPRAASSPGPEA